MSTRDFIDKQESYLCMEGQWGVAADPGEDPDELVVDVVLTDPENGEDGVAITI